MNCATGSARSSASRRVRRPCSAASASRTRALLPICLSESKTGSKSVSWANVTIPESRAELMHELVALVVRTAARRASDQDLQDVQAKHDALIQSTPPVQAADLVEVQVTQDRPTAATEQARDLQEAHFAQNASAVTLLAQSANDLQAAQGITEMTAPAAPSAARVPCACTRGKRCGVYLLQFGASYQRQFEISPNNGPRM